MTLTTENSNPTTLDESKTKDLIYVTSLLTGNSRLTSSQLQVQGEKASQEPGKKGTNSWSGLGHVAPAVRSTAIQDS